MLHCRLNISRIIVRAAPLVSAGACWLSWSAVACVQPAPQRASLSTCHRCLHTVAARSSLRSFSTAATPPPPPSAPPQAASASAASAAASLPGSAGVDPPATNDERRRNPTDPPPSAAGDLLIRLSQLATAGDFAGAEATVLEALAAKQRLLPRHLAMWIESYAPSGEWQRAEQAWARGVQLKVRPTSSMYRALASVYLHTQREEHLVKLPALLSSLRFRQSHLGGLLAPTHHVQLHSADLQDLISDSLRLGLAGATRWLVALAFRHHVWKNMSEWVWKLPEIQRMLPEISAEKAAQTLAATKLKRKLPQMPPLPALFSSLPVDDSRRQGLAVALLNHYALSGNMLLADALMCDAQRRRVVWTIEMVTAYLEVCARASEGDRVLAQKAVNRMLVHMQKLGLTPTASCYRACIAVYLASDPLSASAVATIATLWGDMRRLNLSMSREDFEFLLRICSGREHNDAVRAQVCLWTERAAQAGLWDELDERARRVSERCLSPIALQSLREETPAQRADRMRASARRKPRRVRQAAASYLQREWNQAYSAQKHQQIHAITDAVIESDRKGAQKKQAHSSQAQAQNQWWRHAVDPAIANTRGTAAPENVTRTSAPQ